MIRPENALVLCYHAVSRQWPSQLAVTPEQLSAQVELLLGRGYRGATFTETLRTPRKQKLLAVTFDDGYRSVLDLAWPILDRLGVPGTIFVPTKFIGQNRPMSWPGIDQWLATEHELELRALDWDDLRRLVESGWEVGSHTCSHARLTDVDDSSLADELRESKARCEHMLGQPCTSIAYPYGVTDARVVEATRRAGYAVGGALNRLSGLPAHHAWPRIGVWRADGPIMYRMKVTPWLRHLHSTSRGADFARSVRAWAAMWTARR